MIVVEHHNRTHFRLMCSPPENGRFASRFRTISPQENVGLRAVTYSHFRNPAIERHSITPTVRQDFTTRQADHDVRRDALADEHADDPCVVIVVVPLLFSLFIQVQFQELIPASPVVVNLDFILSHIFAFVTLI